MKSLKGMLLIGLAVLVAVPAVFADGSAWKAQDAEYTLRIKYEPSVSTYAATVQVTTAFIKITGPDLSATHSNVFGPTETFGDVAGAVDAITNASGTRCFDAQVWGALSTDIPSNKVIASSAAAIVNNTWTGYAIDDTSGTKDYRIVTDGITMDQLGGYKVLGVMGEPGGTGNVTVKVYDDDTLLYQKTHVSPTYTLPSSVNYTGVVTQTADNVVSIDAVLPPIYIPRGSKGMIEATRATTGTTGGIGVSVGQADR